ncbi:hypothetical protein TNCV_5107741 [Trichonephila clavipes]|nr:hypothetical protein TNCV_5107741 [Trichonephila clavipes]
MSFVDLHREMKRKTTAGFTAEVYSSQLVEKYSQDLSQLVSSSLRLEKPVTPDEKTNPKRQPQDKEKGDLELRIPLLQVDDCRSGECFLSLEYLIVISKRDLSAFEF